MRKLKSLLLATMYVVVVLGITVGGASAAQHASWNPYVTDTAVSSHDDSFIKVGRKGRRNTAIALGAIALGTIIYKNRQRNYRGSYDRRYGNAHINWCYNRYRSYRDFDNTFQPYHGPRRQCISPYY